MNLYSCQQPFLVSGIKKRGHALPDLRDFQDLSLFERLQLLNTQQGQSIQGWEGGLPLPCRRRSNPKSLATIEARGGGGMLAASSLVRARRRNNSSLRLS